MSIIEERYERISTLQKLNLNAASVDIRSRLQYLFKYLMLVTAHIEGRTLVLH